MNEMRELTDAELESVSGGGLVGLLLTPPFGFWTGKISYCQSTMTWSTKAVRRVSRCVRPFDAWKSECVTIPGLRRTILCRAAPGKRRQKRLNHPCYSAASRTSGAAARTSASTVFSYLVKLFWNMATSLRAVASKPALSFQVFIG